MFIPSLPFLSNLQIHENAPALIDDTTNEWISYGALQTQIKNLLPIFHHDDKKLILCCVPRAVQGVVSYLAAAASGHAIMMVDEAMPCIGDIVNAYQPYWIIVSEKLSVTGYRSVAWGVQNSQLLQKIESSSAIIHPDLFLVLLTSGSTGSAKGVRLSYKNIAHNTNAIIESLGISFQTRGLVHLSLSYSFGLSVLHAQLAVGGSCVLTEHGMMSKEFWHVVRTHCATLFPGVPYHYEMLNKLGLARIDAPSLTVFLQAGGKMRDELTRDMWQKIGNRHGQFFVMYGQTEASPRMTCLPLHHYPKKLGSCGFALSGGTIEIVNNEVIYTGANVMMGYAENYIDLAKGDILLGRLETGDKGSLDADGCLTIHGRKHRFAKLFGQRIALDDLEIIAGAVTQVAAIEYDDKIIVVHTEKDTAVNEKVKSALLTATHLPPPCIEVRNVIALPRNANGKIDYHILKGML
jgi:acyl-coenzyme A synthetase/AMP-(fatty) acid ligase